MDSSPITDKHLGIVHNNWESEKFREVRAKAKEEQEEIKHKAKRNKREKEPQFEIDEEVVIVSDNRNRNYCLVKVIDLEKNYSGFNYYSLVLKVTSEKMIDRIGRLLIFSENHYFIFNGWRPANVKNEGIKWIEKEKTTVR